MLKRRLMGLRRSAMVPFPSFLFLPPCLLPCLSTGVCFAKIDLLARKSAPAPAAEALQSEEESPVPPVLQLLADAFAPHVLRPLTWTPGDASKAVRKNLQSVFMLAVFYFVKRKHNLMTALERSSMKLDEQTLLSKVRCHAKFDERLRKPREEEDGGQCFERLFPYLFLPFFFFSFLLSFFFFFFFVVHTQRILKPPARPVQDLGSVPSTPGPESPPPAAAPKLPSASPFSSAAHLVGQEDAVRVQTSEQPALLVDVDWERTPEDWAQEAEVLNHASNLRKWLAQPFVPFQSDSQARYYGLDELPDAAPFAVTFASGDSLAVVDQTTVPPGLNALPLLGDDFKSDDELFQVAAAKPLWFYFLDKRKRKKGRTTGRRRRTGRRGRIGRTGRKRRTGN